MTEITEAEKGTVSQSQVSQFLGKMRAEGLLQSRKEAQSVHYRIKSREAQEVIKALYRIYCGKGRGLP